MGIFDFLVMALAVWRVSSLFVDERGPFDLFVKIRELAGITHDENKEVAVIPERFWPQLLSCVWCFSMWAAIVCSMLYCLFPAVIPWLCLPFALSTVAVTISCITKN